MFEGFKTFDIQTSDSQVKIHGVVGGRGPPLLLIHGNPLTHVHWHLVARTAYRMALDHPARSVAIVRGEHREILPAAVRPLSGGAGAGRDLR